MLLRAPPKKRKSFANFSPKIFNAEVFLHWQKKGWNIIQIQDVVFFTQIKSHNFSIFLNPFSQNMWEKPRDSGEPIFFNRLSAGF